MKTAAHSSLNRSSRPGLSESQEDYLKQIFLLGEEGDRVSTQALARRLRVQPASVTEMVSRLAQLGLVEHVPYRGVRLTEGGKRVALEMLRHHRLLETYLVEHLGYTWDEVHDEAERLEHVISERFEARIAEMMGHPTRDPHGDPIPTPDLSVPDDDTSVPLQELPVGSTGAIVRVVVQDPESLELLDGLGLSPGSIVEVISGHARGIRIRVGDDRVLVPAHLAEQLWMDGAQS
ncbi:MAG: metal-dependent transcriptional regulator [Acidobacteriota bacterium]